MQAGAGDGVIRQEREGDVAVIVMTNPPVNALSNALRSALAQALADAIADTAVRAIVIRGEGRGFCAGADITEFGKPRTALRLGELCLAIEASPKPVIAAIHGMALGGGMELALAAHYRIAEEAAVMGLPEVNLGLLPGAGGTQRLPRLVGAEVALRIMLTGVPIAASEASGLGLVDRVVGKGLAEAALQLAAEVQAPRPTGERRDGFRDARAYMAAIARTRAGEATNRLPAPGRIIDLVEQALIFPLPQGLVAEETAFAELLATPEAAGLRHAFFAEGRAQKLPASIAGASLPRIATLGLWGGGDEAVEVTLQALAAGMRVILAAPDREGPTALVEGVARRQEMAVQEGRLAGETRDADWARLSLGIGAETLAGCDLVLVGPGMDWPQVMGPPVAGLGAAGPEVAAAITVAAGRSGLAELGHGPDASPEVLLQLAALARRLNWRLVPVGPGGPVELGLRLALAQALEHLATQGIGLDLATEALAAWLRPRRPVQPQPQVQAVQARVVGTALAALAAEGARMLEDGRVARPATVDAVAMMAGLVPRWEGGPMFQADRRGLLVLRHDLMGLAEQAPVFLPCELIDGLIADGKTFASLNGARG